MCTQFSLFLVTARFTVQEQKLEGEFRYVNSRLITNSEEIAFYQVNIWHNRRAYFRPSLSISTFFVVLYSDLELKVADKLTQWDVIHNNFM